MLGKSRRVESSRPVWSLDCNRGQHPAFIIQSREDYRGYEMNFMDIVRACVRPYIAISGWTAFLIIVIIVIQKFLDLEMAKQFAYVFTGAITTIVGVWIGERKAKKEFEVK